MKKPSATRVREDDVRFQRSLSALIDATISLVEDRPVQQISITQLVETAGVTRPTFYQHFSDIPFAAQRAALHRLDQAIPPIGGVVMPMTEDVASQIEHHLLPALTHLADHRTFYLRVIEGGASVTFFEELVRFVASKMSPELFCQTANQKGVVEKDLLDMVAGGSMWLLVRWLRGEIEGSPNSIAQRLASTAFAIHSHRLA